MAKYTGYDFCGWATRNDIKCIDGRTIRRDAFAQQDGAKVPLVWGHNHDSPAAVLGHGFLENRPEGVFFYGYFNESDDAKRAKEDVEHGDIISLSIWANQLKQNGGDILHGSIKEVSLVLAGANIGAQIVYPFVAHGEMNTNEAYIYVGEEYADLKFIKHSDDEDDDKGEKDMDGEKTIQDVLETFDEEQMKVLSYLVAKASTEGAVKHSDEDDDDSDNKEVLEHEDDDDEEDEDMTIEDVLNTMNPTQKKVVNYLVAKAASEGIDDDDDDDIEHSEGGTNMNFNAFEGAAVYQPANYISHSDEKDILATARKLGKLSDALEAYAAENELSHDGLAPVSGATSYPSGQTPAGVDGFFPEYHDVYPGAPQLVTNDQAWVRAVLTKVHKSPFSRIRTSSVDVRNIEEIRARGYAKGKEKVLAGNYAIAKRATDPQTVYVKSALNHDDVVDITDFDYVDYQYKIDRMELELELARAILIGDGRDDASADKIFPDHIRPIWTDPDLYTIKKVLNVTPASNDPGFGPNYLYAQAMEEALLDAKVDYKGTGTPDMFCTQQFFNKLMLAKDLNGRRLYANKNELATALDVAGVYNVPEFANKIRVVGSGASAKAYKLLAIIGNMADYAMGQTKGGEIIHRTQFDIDFNQEKSLLETRVSGATTRIYSFIVIEEETTVPNS